MGSKRYSTSNSADTTLVTTAEGVISTLSGVTADQPGQTIGLRGEFTLTSGAAVTGVTARIRIGSLTGAVVGEAVPDELEVAAGSDETHSIYVEDTSGTGFIGRTYVLTAQQVGGAANGTVLQASLEAEVSP